MNDAAMRVVGGGTPTDAEMAAIAAAASVLVFSPSVVVEAAEVPRWRFSGRWWTKPVPLRRRRP